MRFSDYLKQRRAELGWTQPEAASRIGIEQSYLSKLENGKSLPSADVYDRLAAALKIDTKAMADLLYPAELDRLRDVDAVRGMIMTRQKKSRLWSRTWMIAAIAMLVIGGGLIGLAFSDTARTQQLFSYQSLGVIEPGEELDIYARVYDPIDPNAPDANARQAQRQSLIKRMDDQIKRIPEYRGPSFIEQVGEGRRVWTLVGGEEALVEPRFDWAHIPGWALIFGSFGCFFASRRWA